MGKQNNRQSFTLIEILVVATIIVVLSGTSLAIFSSFRDDKVLNNQTQLFSGVLELAKTKARSGDTSLCSNSTQAYISGYQVTVDKSQSKIIMSPNCDTNPTPIFYAIPSNISYIPSPFTLLFGSQNYQGEDKSYVLKNDETLTCMYVSINEAGLITNGEITCPTPTP